MTSVPLISKKPPFKEVSLHGQHLLSSLLLAGLIVGTSQAQQSAKTANQSVLDRRYKAAQDFQAANELDKAAQQYRIFIADSLGQIAIGRAHAGEYDKASPAFDEALTLVPNFPALQLEYARVAFENDNIDRARLLSSSALQNRSLDPKLAAKAHALLGRVLLKLGKNDEAKREIEQAVSLDPTFENGYELAIADLDLGDGDAATKIFSEMLTSFGDTAQIHMLFGQAYAGSDFQNNAVKEFKAAIAKDDRLPGAHYSLASVYLSTAGSSKLPEVESELHKEIAISPDSAFAYAALGHLLNNQRETADRGSEALKYLMRAAELDPQNPDAFLYLGQFYSDAKMPLEAEAALRKSIALTKDVSRNGYQVQKAHYLLGRTLIQSDQPEEGKKEFAASQALMKQNLSRDENRLSDYLQDDKTDSIAGMGKENRLPTQDKDVEAVHRIDEAEKSFAPAIADSYNNLGAIAATESNYRQALGYFKQAAEWSPTLPGLDYNWGRAAFAAGSPAEAVGPLSSYLREHPDDEGARNVLGLSQFLSKDYSGTRKTLAPVADKPDATSQVKFAYAKSLVETSDFGEGVPRLQALEKADSSIADIHLALGEAYSLQNSPNAKEELETAIRLNPKDAEAHAALGHVQLKNGNTQDGIRNLETAVQLDPANKTFRDDLAHSKLKESHE